MPRMNRRQFAKTLGAATIAAPLMPSVAAAFKPLQVAPQNPASDAPKPPGANLPLTPELQERLHNVLERDARRRALMRTSPLPYDLEPAFVFTVRRRLRGPRKGD